METAKRDAAARWLGFIKGLQEARRRLALAAFDPGEWRGLAALLVAGEDSMTLARGLAARDPGVQRWVCGLRAARDALEYLETLGGWVLAPGEAGWPPALSRGAGRPAVLAGRGSFPEGPALAIVGTRGSSPEGDALAGELAAAWVARGGWVVSGGARGIDAAAHRSALAAGGRTVVVAGTGLGHPFPFNHRSLFRRIEEAGAVVSEYPPIFPGRPWSFLDRNRIIAGIAEAVVVVEAPPRSGALSTARFALKCGKKVLTVPGNPADPRSAGARSLLDRGASPLRGPEDLPACREAPGPLFAVDRSRRPPQDPAARRVLEALVVDGDGDGGGWHLDEIGRRLALDPGTLSAALLELELGGFVDALGGGRFRRVPGGQ